jgi:hypothetical protein
MLRLELYKEVPTSCCQIHQSRALSGIKPSIQVMLRIPPLIVEPRLSLASEIPSPKLDYEIIIQALKTWGRTP